MVLMLQMIDWHEIVFLFLNEHFVTFRIDHWDNEREKMMILCDYSLLVVRYDFIAQKRLECKRILLHMVQSVILGDIVYPEKSLMPWVLYRIK